MGRRRRTLVTPYLRRVLWPAWLGSLRRTQPLSRNFGYERGNPVDRYYIDRFLTEHRSDIRGRVLEVKEAMYTRRLGTSVERSDVLDIYPANPRATVLADLAAADTIASDSFDCFILTQTLHLIYKADAAVRHAHRLLRPGGVLLVSVPAVIRVADPPEPDYWRFTPEVCTRLFGDIFGREQVVVRGHGNVLACIAFLAGMAQEELRTSELDADDPLFPLVVTVRAVKGRS